MYISVAVKFFSDKRKVLPHTGYRPDIIVDKRLDNYF
jgi:hypothetical protein